MEQLECAVTEAVNWGLLSPISQDLPQMLTIQPVLPYFLKTKLKDVDEETRAALQEGFKNHYQWLARSYDNLMESKEPQEKQMGIAFVRWEYENLYQGLQICLERKASVYSIWFCLLYYLELISNKSEQLQLTKDLHEKLSEYNPEDSYEGWEGDIVPISGNLAKCYLESQDYQKAKKIYENVLDLIPQFKNIEDSQKQSYLATSYHQLGRVFQDLREYEPAKQYFQKAISIYKKINNRYEQADSYGALGMVAQELRQYQQANDYYQKALEICIEYGDRYSQARTYGQLGAVALIEGEYQQANDYYQQALSIFIEYSDRYSSAKTYHNLGSVALELTCIIHEEKTKYKKSENNIKINF